MVSIAPRWITVMARGTASRSATSTPSVLTWVSEVGNPAAMVSVSPSPSYQETDGAFGGAPSAASAVASRSYAGPIQAEMALLSGTVVVSCARCTAGSGFSTNSYSDMLP